MNLPRISVIVRAHNPNEWIFEAINSIIDQEYQGEIEIIVCYDRASKTDEILYKLKQLSTQFMINRSMKIIVHEHTSPTRALFEHGFREATGDYILVLDYDNKMPKDYISRIISFALENDFIFTNPMLIDEAGNVLGFRAHERIPRSINVISLAKGNVCDMNGIVLSRRAMNTLLKYYDDYLKNLRITDLVHEDYFIAMICSKLLGAKYVDSIYTFYRVHKAQQTYLIEFNIDKVCQILLRDIVTLYTVLRVLGSKLSFFERIYITAMMFKRLLYVIYLMLGLTRTLLSAALSFISSFIGYLKMLIRSR